MMKIKLEHIANFLFVPILLAFLCAVCVGQEEQPPAEGDWRPKSTLKTESVLIEKRVNGTRRVFARVGCTNGSPTCELLLSYYTWDNQYSPQISQGHKNVINGSCLWNHAGMTVPFNAKFVLTEFRSTNPVRQTGYVLAVPAVNQVPNPVATATGWSKTVLTTNPAKFRAGVNILAPIGSGGASIDHGPAAGPFSNVTTVVADTSRYYSGTHEFNCPLVAGQNVMNFRYQLHPFAQQIKAMSITAAAGGCQNNQN